MRNAFAGLYAETMAFVRAADDGKVKMLDHTHKSYKK